MIKKDLGSLKSPYFEQTLENKVRFVFYPRKSHLKSAIIYVSHGGFYREEEISSTKIPFGAAYYLENIIMSDSFKEELGKKGILGKSHTDFSYTAFELDTLGDLYTGLELFFDRITLHKFKEEEVEVLNRKEMHLLEERESSPILTVQKKALDNLYYESPIKRGVVPLSKEAVSIHISALKRFLENYYVPTSITVFVSMDDTPTQFIERVKNLHFPSPSPYQEKSASYHEIYDKVHQDFTEFKCKSDASYLAYGVKMPSRKDLYENYGQTVFYFYEILLPLLFTSNPDFKEGLKKNHAELVSSSLEQGAEDCYLLLTLKCNTSRDGVEFLTDYLSKCSTHIDKKLLRRVENEYYMRSLANLYVPSDALHGFISAYANNLSYTGLIHQASKLTFTAVKNYLGDLETFKRAASYLYKE